MFPEDSRWPECCLHGLSRVKEIGPLGNQIRAGFTIGEYDILVHRVDFGKRAQQIAQINLGAAHASRNQVQRVHADSNHWWLSES